MKIVYAATTSPPAGPSEAASTATAKWAGSSPNVAKAHEAPKTAKAPVPAAMATECEQNKIASTGTRATHKANEPVPVIPANSPSGAASVTTDKRCARSNALVRDT